jgi:hypothetical protein
MAMESPPSAPSPRSIGEDLCEILSARCVDPNIAWPYHPRVGLGRLLLDSLVHALETRSPQFASGIRDGSISLQLSPKIGGKRRQKKIDLVIERDNPAAALVAIEIKSCMTAHSKAHSRLVAELTSSLDALLDADTGAKFFAMVAINYGTKFTSPLNLPGPNVHDPDDAPALTSTLHQSLSNNIEMAGTLVIPIAFDNETSCRMAIDDAGHYRESEANFVTGILGALGLPAS